MKALKRKLALAAATTAVAITTAGFASAQTVPTDQIVSPAFSQPY